ncbi:TerC family protein [Microlunatus lacustris]
MEVHPYAWAITVVVMVVILTVDVFIIGRRPHEPSTKEASTAIAFFVSLAVLFGLGVWFVSGGQYAGEFFAGWITEYSLSVDNLFIFLIIMSKLKVPRELQQFALLIGIILALIFRGIFIAVGAAAIERFAWVFFVFGAFLVYTAVKLFLDYRKHDDDEDAPENAVMRLVRRKFNATPDYRGTKLTVKENGKRFITPMFFVIVALGSTDLLFALDSIPAIYGLTQEPYLVFTANVFALMGLRQLYFLIGGLLKRLVYLSLGLSVILAFIGVKLVLHALHEYHWADWAPWGGEIPIWFSLLIIVGTLAITTVASLLKSRRDPVEPTEPLPDQDPAERPAGVAEHGTPPAAP